MKNEICKECNYPLLYEKDGECYVCYLKKLSGKQQAYLIFFGEQLDTLIDFMKNKSKEYENNFRIKEFDKLPLKNPNHNNAESLDGGSATVEYVKDLNERSIKDNDKRCQAVIDERTPDVCLESDGKPGEVPHNVEGDEECRCVKEEETK